MNYNKIITFDTGNSRGISTTLFVSGCRLRCKNCHNQQTWDFNSGEPFTTKEEKIILDSLESSHVKYFVVSGGNPVEEENINKVADLCEKAIEKGKQTICYSGYTIEELIKKYPSGKELSHFNYIIDGTFDMDKTLKGLDLRGSYNQQCYKNHGNKFVNISTDYFKELYFSDFERYRKEILYGGSI